MIKVPVEATSWGLKMSLYRPAKTIEMVVGKQVKEPPITAGRQVPNIVWNNVFNPATNCKV